MTARERGFLLLTSHLGNPERSVLSTVQLRELAKLAAMGTAVREDRDVEERDLIALGLGKELAQRVTALLRDEEQLDYYLRKGARMGCTPLTRVSGPYPQTIRQRLGLDSPGCLWGRGNMEILRRPKISLVGSRELEYGNRSFAEKTGRQAAIQGYALVSGNARGADRVAQEACLAAGGYVISVVADELQGKTLHDHVLYLSEEDYDAPFTAIRALSRNRIIHCLGRAVFVAQSSLEHGGTWDGTVKNLRNNWSTVYGFRDGSAAMEQLYQMGAIPVDGTDVEQLSELTREPISLFTQNI